MNRLTATAAAAVIALSSTVATASTTALGPVTVNVPLIFGGFAPVGAFVDTFTFSLPANGGSGYSIVNFTGLGPAFNISLATLSLFADPDGIPFTPDDVHLDTSVAPGGSQLNLTWGPSAASPMYLVVTGISNGTVGGAYAGAIVAAPVPEPETYAMMLAGLCAVGFMAARRKSQG